MNLSGRHQFFMSVNKDESSKVIIQSTNYTEKYIQTNINLNETHFHNEIDIMKTNHSLPNNVSQNTETISERKARLIKERRHPKPLKNAFEYQPPSIEATYPMVYGVLSYAYLNGTIPKLYEEIDIAQPAELYKNLDLSIMQPYHYQKSHQISKHYFEYTPETYDIPITRHFSVYSFPTFDNPKHPFDDLLLVGFIKAAPDRFGNRQMIRKSYLNFDKVPMLMNKIKIYFVSTPTDDKVLTTKLLEEQRTYNDLILVNTIDTYSNLTLKTLIMEDLFVAFNSTSKYYMSMDDDTCVDLYQIYLDILIYDKTKFYFGKHLTQYPTDQLIKKHSVPYDVLDNGLKFAFGPSYIMSRDVVFCHIQYIRQLYGFFHVDDLLVGYISSLCGIAPQQSNRWMCSAVKMIGQSLEFPKRNCTTAYGLGKPEQFNEVCISVYSRDSLKNNKN
ncbi:hypothetical protein WA158_008095 [Blastocystis sp. Blastoise]